MLKRNLFLILLVVCLDQVSKILVLDIMKDKQHIIAICEYLNIVFVLNKGISFGMFASFAYINQFFFMLATLIVCYLLKWLKDSAILSEQIALSFIIGGAIGNIIDRVYHEGVVDFIQLHYKEYYWPSFNVADAAICLGVFILFMLNIQNKAKLIEKVK